MTKRIHTEHYEYGGPTQSPRRGRLPLLFALCGLLLILIWLVISGIKIANAVSSLNENVSRAQNLVDQGIRLADPNDIELLILDTNKDVATLNSTAMPFLRIAPFFSWLPGIGSLLKYSPNLMEMADAGSQSAVDSFRALKPVLVHIQQSNGGVLTSLPQILQLIEAGQDELMRASQEMDRVVEARRKIKDTAGLPLQIQQALSAYDDNISLAGDGLKLLPVLPELLGNTGQKSYLILAQNEDELRGTGGFISGAGLLIVKGGQIISMTFNNANAVDDWQHKPYDLPPQPFRDFMGMDIYLFRDANFWPDFPYSARQAMQLYSYGQDVPVDGVVAIDQQFLQMLLAAIGPVEVPDLATIVNNANIIAELRRAWGPEDGAADWVNLRKAFMGPLSNAILLALQTQGEGIDWLNLSRTISEAIAQRHLQFYVSDPLIAGTLADIGWDGRQENIAGQDFLLVIDTNLGFNKASAAVKRYIDYSIVLDAQGGGTGELAITYEHAGTANDDSCDHGTIYDENTRYTDLIQECYWNYLRVYVPGGSNLLEASRHPVSATSLMSGVPWNGIARTTSDPESDLVVFDNFVLIEPGLRETTIFKYALPSLVTRTEDGHVTYHLAVNKQAGVQSQVLRINIGIPQSARIIQILPEPISVSEREIYFEIEQATDINFEVEYELAR